MPSWIQLPARSEPAMTGMTFVYVCQYRLCGGTKKRNQGRKRQKTDLAPLRGCPATPGQTRLGPWPKRSDDGSDDFRPGRPVLIIWSGVRTKQRKKLQISKKKKEKGHLGAVVVVPPGCGD